jgi:arylamine N-acetyltransferase
MVLVERYLRLLGIAHPPSGLAGLREVVRRHLCRVPFENVSKLLLAGREGVGRETTLDEFLDGLEHYDLGGTCYTSNPFLASLLRALGYDAGLLGADMSRPNVHTCIRVRIGPHEYHVDVGYGGPFREPVRLDRLPHQIPHGPWRYVFDRGSRAGEYKMAVFSGAERVHGYTVHGPARDREFFRPIVHDSFRPTATFMNCLRIARFFDRHAVELQNTTLTRYHGSESSQTTLGSMAELRRAMDKDLAMPRCPVEQAVAILDQITGKPFFDSGAAPCAASGVY